MLIDESTELQIARPVPAPVEPDALNVCPRGALLYELTRSNPRSIVLAAFGIACGVVVFVLLPREVRGGSIELVAADVQLIVLLGALAGVSGALVVAAITAFHPRPLARQRSKRRTRVAFITRTISEVHP